MKDLGKIAKANLDLVKYGLVKFTGVMPVRINQGLIVIKPSGVTMML